MAGVYKLDIVESEAELKKLLRQEKVIVSMVGRPHQKNGSETPS